MLNSLQVIASVLLGRLGVKSERGASAVEYGIMVAGIAVAIIATVMAIGPVLDGLFDNVLGELGGGEG